VTFAVITRVSQIYKKGGIPKHVLEVKAEEITFSSFPGVGPVLRRYALPDSEVVPGRQAGHLSSSIASGG
jgi:hypothetical protein